MAIMLLTIVFASECVSAKSDEISEEDLGIRKETLFDESRTSPVHGVPIKKEAGESEKIERAFESSPPLIPHDITGMLPISRTDNSCMGCHMPGEASRSGATAIPKSHLVDLKTGKDLGGALDGDRYVCMQCHVIQTTVTPAVENIFKGEFIEEKNR
jgi:cytochrome c-type protein NapB